MNKKQKPVQRLENRTAKTHGDVVFLAAVMNCMHRPEKPNHVAHPVYKPIHQISEHDGNYPIENSMFAPVKNSIGKRPGHHEEKCTPHDRIQQDIQCGHQEIVEGVFGGVKFSFEVSTGYDFSQYGNRIHGHRNNHHGLFPPVAVHTRQK